MSRFQPPTLMGIALLYGSLLGLSTGVLAFASYRLTIRTIDYEIDHRLRDTASAIIGNERPPDRRAIIRRLQEREYGHGADGTGYLLRGADGRALAGKLRIVPPPLGSSDVDYHDRVDGVERGRAFAQPTGDGATLILVADTDLFENFTGRLGMINSTRLVLTLLIFAAGLAAMMRAIARQMAAIRTTAEAIIDGDLSSRLAVNEGRDEFALEAATFNRMLDRISTLLTNLKHVSDDIAHDLRTPLSRLRNRLVTAQDLLQQPLVGAELEKAIQDCDHLLSLFAALLRISEIEAGRRRAMFAPVALDELAQSIVEGFEAAIVDGGRTLIATTLLPVTIEGDRDLLAQMIINLVENAERYTPVGSEIAIAVMPARNGAIVRVSDNGPGIPADQREEALRRFGRLAAPEASRLGLGLPLVSAIAQLHDGRVMLGHNAPGLVVTVTLHH